MMLLLTVSVYANPTADNSVVGKVTSASDGEPLIGVSVLIKGVNKGTTTDVNGNYSINVSPNQTLAFSYLGYRTKEVKVGNRKRIDITLSEDHRTLDELVVVGYGTMKRSDLTGAVVSVSGDEIKKTVVTSFDQALQGRAAGVQVTQNSGAPGGGVSVSIRGTNSFNGNEPLYVIDGVPISGQGSGNSDVLSSINPGDIVSLEVLKDASATAIYGSRASNGVILITTRRGENGKPKLSYEGYYALQQIPKKLDVLNLREYAEYQNERAAVLGWGAREEFKDPSLLGEGTNWQDALFRTAPMQNHQVGITGGNDSGKYAISLGYLSQDGIAIGSKFERLSARVNFDTKITKWLDVGLSASVSRSKQVNTIDNGGLIATAIRQLPEVPVKNADGTYGTQSENIYGTYFSNPIAEALMRENYSKGSNVYANAYAIFKLVKGLDFHLEYGGSYNYSNAYQFTPSYDYGYFNQQSSSYRGASNGYNWLLKTYLNYNLKLGKHSMNAMAGHESQENGWESLSGSRTNFFLNSVHELNVGDALTAKNNSSKNSGAIESYFGRFNYNFADRYLMTFTLRADGSSNFGPNNRWGWFPSLAFGWRINNESFMKHVKSIDNLKLRLGWGIVGNQNAGGYAYGTTMASIATVWGTGFYAGNYANENLKWEETKAFNAGLDLAMFKNRIELIFDTYYKKTDNLLMQASLPAYVNGVISSPWVNVGAMTNKGFEVTLNTVNISHKSFTWRTGITFSLNRNKVTQLYTKSSAISGYVGSDLYTYSVVGEPVGQFYGYHVIGMFKKADDFYQKDAKGNVLLDKNGDKVQVAIPEGKTIKENEVWIGDYQFEDVNNDGVINEKDRKFLGNPEPKFTYGLNNTFTYKNFDLNVFICGTYGNKVFNYLRQQYTNPMSNSGLLKEVTGLAILKKVDESGDNTLENVYVANTNATVQRITMYDANANNRMSNRFIEDGSYLRIKNISLGYTFPKAWLEKVQVNSVRLYVNVQNAFTFTKYKGYDPEVGAYNYSVTTRGIDYARYPSQRIYTFGLNVEF